LDQAFWIASSLQRKIAPQFCRGLPCAKRFAFVAGKDELPSIIAQNDAYPAAGALAIPEARASKSKSKSKS
jgi:hypothetical protein